MSAALEFVTTLAKHLRPLGAGRIEDPRAVLRYVLAGNSTFTLVSKRTGERFTFRVRAHEEEPRHFVSLLNGPSNEADFVYLGTIFQWNAFRHGRKSRVSTTAPSAKAFAWFFANLSRGYLSTTMEFWHEGSCGRCGRKLTVPASVATGLGPECAGRAR